jgi:hypothetical protein
LERKSVPRIGFETAAGINVQRNVRIPKERVRVTLPQGGIIFPSALAGGGPEGAADSVCGRTLTAAPVSTRNFCLLLSSWRKTWPPRVLTCAQQRPSFLSRNTAACTCWLSVPACCDRIRERRCHSDVFPDPESVCGPDENGLGCGPEYGGQESGSWMNDWQGQICWHLRWH